IGLGIARRLAQAKFSVTIIGRNETRGAEIIAEFEREYGHSNSIESSAIPRFTFVKCDVAQLANVDKACTSLLANNNCVDTLVLTQGKASMDGRRETNEGIDNKMSLHYFSRMLFVNRLLPALRKSPSGAPRVLSVLSAGVHSNYANFKTDFELKKNFSLKNAADAAGFYNDLMLDSFARDQENKNVAFFHAAPGIVTTEYFSEFPWVVKTLLSPLGNLIGKSIDDCGIFMTDCLFNPAKNDASITGHINLINETGGSAKKNAFATDDARDFVREKTDQIFSKMGFHSLNVPAIRALAAKNANISFPGRHAVVVGGTSGIGLGIAHRLAQADFSVTIIGRNETRGAKIISEFEREYSYGSKSNSFENS
ncbi:hypothetical protein HK100_010308, partial [Physocladia obscura]